MARLFPRLIPQDAAAVWESLSGHSCVEMERKSDTTHPAEYFAPVGGQRVEAVELGLLRSEIVRIARSHGYPRKATLRSAAAFDAELAIFLATDLEMTDGEAFRSETWAFLSILLVPHVVKWRFPGFHPSRCTGGRRDCLQRLWLRSRLFDLGEGAPDRWKVLHGLSEDAFVSIVERPTLAGSPRICRALGLAWLKTSDVVGKARMEAVNRAAIKRFRARGTLLSLDVLDDKTLESIAQECFSLGLT